MMGTDLAPVLYTLHMRETARFIERTANRLGAVVDFSKHYKLRLPYQLPFQKKSVKYIDVTLFRIVRG